MMTLDDSEAGLTGRLNPEQSPSRPGKPGLKAFSSLKNRDFRLLWISTFTANNGMQMLILARGWLVYTMTDSALALGLVAAGMGAPMVLFSVFGGALADRVQKRNLILLTQSLICLLNIIMSILITFDLIALWHLVTSSIVMGTISAFGMPTRQAFIVDLVEGEDLTNAIALNSVSMNLCRIGSPALAGVLLKIIGVPGVYWLVGASYASVVLILARIDAGRSVSVKFNMALWQDVFTGFRYIRDNSTLLFLLMVAFVPIIVATPYQTLMPVFAKTVFSAGETGLGLLMSAGGVGALCGSALVASIGYMQRKGILMLATGIVFGSALVLFGFCPSLQSAMVVLFFVGGGGSMFMTLITSLIMGNTPQELIGRVMSIFIMTFGLMPLVMLPAGALAEAFGAPIVVSVGGAGLVGFLVLIAVSQPRIRKLN
ncbi:MAG: MFS transporter [Deltaproteobacteria bacterium]|nr:MFS transporter [Deltaproteobacteria bacterium]